jgi:hypothetical protein
MKLFRHVTDRKNERVFAAGFLAFWILCGVQHSSAQEINAWLPSESAASGDVPDAESKGEPVVDGSFRIEKVPVDGGAELLTIIARPRNIGGAEVPLVSVLRDTLGDRNPENDRLRYVWNLAYAKPSFRQRLAAFVPFLYSRTTNKKSFRTSPPPPVLDMAPNDNGPWNTIFQIAIRKVVLGKLSATMRAPLLQYRQNRTDYRRAAIARSLAALSSYQPQHRETLLSESELKDIQARLWLTEKTFGWHMQSEYLTKVYDKELGRTRDVRNQNWELLRQFSERQGLYFDPLKMPDGSVRHAILWADAADIQANANKKFDSRFLNIKSPWDDRKLLTRKGYSEVRWFDESDRQVAIATPNAVAKTMIPLAVYGFDFPKIPTLLVDFRDNGNVKRREMSRRVLHDATANLVQLSLFGSLPIFLGRYGYNYVTGKRGMDVNRGSRLRSYAQLKLLLSLDSKLDENLNNEIAKRLEYSSLNPLENDVEGEAQLARGQYDNLIAYAKRPDGLQARIDRDRRQEMVRLLHSGKERTLFSLAHFFSFGLYTHRENSTPELLAQMDIRRQLEHHERYLREVAINSAGPEIDGDVEALKRSLLFVSQNGAAAKKKTTRALARIFSITQDEEMRRLSLGGLYRINNSEAKKQLLTIYGNSSVTDQWRELCAQYLRRALGEGQQISRRDAQTISGIEAN